MYIYLSDKIESTDGHSKWNEVNFTADLGGGGGRGSLSN